MEGMGMKATAEASQSNQAPKPVAAEVRKIYPDTGKITLKHGDIDNLGMGAMTMTFAVKDKASLKNFKEGDKVMAVFDMVNGQPTVVEMHGQ
ncbi:putative signal peptide protein [Ralstonia solanacearum SD54]|nr:putative signal peptide protein [Ralstonia solanacearum SD54]